MTMNRYFFVNEGDYKPNQIFSITGQEHNHICKVLRMKVGDKIVCLPNNNMLINCEIVSFSKEETKVRILGVEESQNECKTSLTVFVSLLKSDKFEFLITKLTELGVKKIVPFETKFMTAKQNKNKNERLNQIAKDACKQCRRARVIDIEKCLTFNQMLERINKYDKAIFAYENEKATLLTSIDVSQSNNVAIIIGSEGGFDCDEAEKIKNAGAITVSLGKRILRAETAVIALASIMQYKLNEI